MKLGSGDRSEGWQAEKPGRIVFTAVLARGQGAVDERKRFISRRGLLAYHPKMGGYPDLYNHLLDGVMKLITVATFKDAGKAILLQRMLEDHRISATIPGEDFHDGYIVLKSGEIRTLEPAVRVQVWEKDADAAREIFRKESAS